MHILFWRPPSWISGGCRHHTIPEVAPLKCLTPISDNIEIAVGILLLCALELEICLGEGGDKIPPAAGKHSQKTAAGTKVNLMTDIVFFG